MQSRRDLVHCPPTPTAPTPVAAVPRVPSMPQERPPGPPVRVLVADDNPDAAHSLTLLLELQGYLARVAPDGEEALALAAAFRPQVLVSELYLPKLSGLEVARRLRLQHRPAELLLVAVTAFGRPEHRHQAHQAGFDHFLLKPVLWAELEQLLVRPRE